MENRNIIGKVLFVVLIIAIIAAIKFIIIPTNMVEVVAIIPKKIEVTAHRGLSAYYPENTMEAFEKAHEIGADWVELDVQETKDLIVVVTHYLNLKTLAKINKNVWSLKYKDLKKINVGSYMGKEAYIPMLEEVIVWAKSHNVKLNIELKDNGHLKKLVESTIDLINKYDYKNNSIVASQNYQLLNDVKDYDSTITTAYVGRKLDHEVSAYIYADIFSIKKTELSKELVDEMHNNGKKVYAWTILNEEEVFQMVDYDVDNLIANDVKLVQEALIKSKTSR